MFSSLFKSAPLQNLLFFLTTLLIIGFFFLDKSEHRILSYLTYATALFAYRNKITLLFLNDLKEFRLFFFFLIYAFFLSLFYAIPDMHQVVETFRLILLPLLFVATMALALDKKEKWDLLFLIFIGIAVVFGIATVIEFYFIESKTFLSPPRYSGWGRMGNPNIAGFVYSTAFVVFLSQINHIQTLCISKICKVFLYFVIPLIFLLAILATQSRNALVAVAFASLIYFLLEKKFFILSIIIFLTVSFFGAIILYLGDFSDFISRGSNFRKEIWLYTISEIKDNLFFGNGYQSEFYFSMNNFSWSSPHNLLLGSLYQFGAIGTILFVLGIMKIIEINFKEASKKKYYTPLLLMVLGAAFSLFEMKSIFINLSYEWLISWFPFAYVCALRIYKEDFHLQKE